MSSEARSKLLAMGGFFGISLLAGVLVAGLVAPAAAFTGVGGAIVATSLTEVPIFLETKPQAERTTVYLANGKVLTEFYDENRIIVGLDEIAKVMIDAQVAIEDDRFFEHGALDLKSLIKASLGFVGGGDTGGGSTLTQQYVKQVLMEEAVQNPDPIEREEELARVQARTIERKLLEMRYALFLEERHSKEWILENYLNIAYYGDGSYGVEAAAHHYFAVTAADLTLGQAAVLAGIVQTPSRNPVNDPEGAYARRDVVLDRMEELGLVTAEEVEEAKAEVWDPKKVTYPKNGCYGLAKYGQVCRLVWEYLMNNEALGKTEGERQRKIMRGGYEIHTYIDPEKQDAVQSAVSNYIAATDPVVSAMVVIQPGTGIILGAAQNRSVYGFDIAKGESAYLSFAPAYLGGDQGYQAGSTFKGFTVAAALKAGYPPAKKLNAKGFISFTGKTFRSCDGAFPAQGFPVQNTSQNGVMDMYK
ncbi:MAG: penicillin-binding protein, partial [Propionibacteriaceae bacterium]|nr:penicillin-binding protein [Propionibacteriaceae bacterium]